MNVLILGAGFAGVHTAVHLSRKLKDRVRVTLVDANHYHLFKPMLHEVATAGVDSGHILQPVQQIVKDRPIGFVRGVVQEIDPARRQVRLCSDCACCPTPERCAEKEFDLDPRSISMRKAVTLDYDRLVIALGASPNDFGIPGVREHAMAFNGLEDAEKIRKRIVCCFEMASRVLDESKRRAILTFAVVGAGPTGIELASDLHDWLFDALPQEFGDVSVEEIGLHLVEAGHNILPTSPEDVRDKARRLLGEKRIQVHTESPVGRVDKGGLELKEHRIEAYTTIWTAGVRGNEALKNSGLPLDSVDRIRVDPFLRVEGLEEVYAVGDCSVHTPRGSEHPLPPTAQVAVQEAAFLVGEIRARILGKPLRPFEYRDLGMSLSAGRHQAVASFAGIFRLQGVLGWLAWKATYLKHLLSIRLSFRSLLNWFLDITFDRESSRHTL